MIVLAIETSTVIRSVAIVGETGVRTMKSLPAGNEERDTLISDLETVLRESEVRPAELDAIAVSIGPGMFTGLRVGLAAAKGLAFAVRKPIVPVSSLEALAASLVAPGAVVWALLDARRGEVYGAAFRLTEGLPERLTEDRLGSVENVLAGCGGATCFIGSGADRYRDRIGGIIASGARLMETGPFAGAVGKIGLIRMKQAPPADPASLVPVYLRPLQDAPA